MKIRQPGYLLLELVCVFALLSLIIGFAFARMDFISAGNARQELDLLYQTCLYAQRRAISSGKPCTVILDTERGQYSCDERIRTLEEGVRFDFLPQVKGPPSAPQQPILKASTFKQNRISCSSEGIIDAGTVYLTDRSRKCLYALTSGIAPYSYLRKYRYAGTWERLR